MQYQWAHSLLILCGVFNIIHAQRDKIVFADEIPNLVEDLNFSSAISTRFSIGNSKNTCVTRSGQRVTGSCVSLKECPELNNLFNGENAITRSEAISVLRRRFCRFKGNVVHFCCMIEASSITLTTTLPSTPVSLPTTGECGFTTNAVRITNGTIIKPGAHPWLAAVGHPIDPDDVEGPFRIICGGTLITMRHVITAAHCFVTASQRRSITNVRLGEHSLSLNNETVPPITLRIVDRKSAEYDTVSHVNDIALLVMERDVQFSAFIRPACLPFGLETRNFANEAMTIVGWGDTFFGANRPVDMPRQAVITVVPKMICRQDYASEPQVPLDNTQLCAGKGAKDACQSDSGGPLMFIGSRYFLMGIVSFGVQCGNPNFPGVYTYIPEFLGWISDNL